MNRIMEDRLLIDDCEKTFAILKNALKGKAVCIHVDKMLEKIKNHREKFTRRVLDKEAYIKKNKELFDAIYANYSRKVGGSYFEVSRDEVYRSAIEAEKKIQADLVATGFYSAKTARMDMIRSLMTTYEKLYINN